MKNSSSNFLYTLEKSILDFRRKIDKIDNSIMELINNRLKLVKKLGKLKRRGGWHIIDGNRENEILSRLDQLNMGPIESRMLHDIFNIIIEASREIQTKKRIAYIGSKASSAHMLALNHFGFKLVSYFPVSTETEIIRGIDEDLYDYGLIYLECYDEILPPHLLNHFLTSEVKIYAESLTQVTYELVAKNLDPDVLNTAYLCEDMIEACSSWLRYYVPHVHIIRCKHFMDAISQALNNESSAAVGFRGTADLFNLKMVFSSIGFVEFFSERYLFVGKRQSDLPNKSKTSIVCALPDISNVLIKVLRHFFNVNIAFVKVEQCNSVTMEKDKVILISFNGHVNSEEFDIALNEFSKDVLWIKNLGTYPVIIGEGICF